MMFFSDTARKAVFFCSCMQADIKKPECLHDIPVLVFILFFQQFQCFQYNRLVLIDNGEVFRHIPQVTGN